MKLCPKHHKMLLVAAQKTKLLAAHLNTQEMMAVAAQNTSQCLLSLPKRSKFLLLKLPLLKLPKRLKTFFLELALLKPCEGKMRGKSSL